MAYLY
ncbi:MAG: hypothetical protein QG562_670, partial [Patescibacteria group bacterium]